MSAAGPYPDLARLADGDLTMLVGRGDADALEVLSDRHSRASCSLVFHLLGGPDCSRRWGRPGCRRWRPASATPTHSR